MEMKENKPATDLLTPSMIKLIERHNAASKANSFFYNNPDSHELYKELRGKFCDRFDFVSIQNKVERDLIEAVHNLYDGVECYVTPRRSKTPVKGIIKHALTREYEGRTLDNTVSFRREYEHETYSAPETIALWVDTGDTQSTHLYTVNNIFIDYLQA